MWTFLNRNRKYIFNEGPVYSTSYHVVYESPTGRDLLKGIEQRMRRLDHSLSAFNPTSILSEINQNKTVRTDRLFRKCFRKAREVSLATEGAFDMTVSPMVNAWGFGFKNKEQITDALITGLLQKVGYNKVKLHWGYLKKEHPDIMLDGSAIAKGLAVDEVVRYLQSKGCRNYMVEIGGEVFAKGVNQNDRTWRVGISRPENDNFSYGQEYQAIVSISGKALATSGNYRNFYMEGDKKYAHTIDPRNGYPVQESILSATVLANDCMTADAYATAFMVLGVEKSLEIVAKTRELECFLIYGDQNGVCESVYSNGFGNFLV